ncbi:MAG: alpha/beta hydrolase [Promethearchaeota archaeon]
MEEKSINKSSIHRNFIYITLTLNLVSIVFGIFYYIFRFYDYVSNVFGFILFTTYMFNFILTLGYDRIETIPKKTRRILRIFSVVYLVYSIFAVLMMLGGNLLVQITYGPSFSDNIVGLLLNMGGFFGMLIFGTVFSSIATARVNEVSRGATEPVAERTIGQKIGAIIGQVLCFLLLILGILTSYVVLTGKLPRFLWFLYIIVYFIPECALYFGILFLTATILALRLIPKKKKIYFYAVMVIGLSISTIHVIPSAMTSVEVVIANNRYTDAFGPSWQSIPAVDEKYMTRSPYSFARYMLGMHPDDYIVQRDVLYYDGYADPKDENITLYFDAYMPSRNAAELPGKNSTLIRFHGGGLSAYDKGLPNMQKMNYYFASQGYIVFDIQYGLYGDPSYGSALTPANVKGNFTIDDIMRHVGIFMQYLDNNSAVYGANLNSVFFSGGSAGGLLTCTTAYTLQHANYTFYNGQESSFDVKGIIPFYPWVNVSGTGSIKGSYELLQPYRLADAGSVPCLIYQGNMDSTVDPEVTQLLQDAYDVGGAPCATLPMFFAEHVSDMFFEGYFNQVFLYYMERFMYQYR